MAEDESVMEFDNVLYEDVADEDLLAEKMRRESMSATEDSANAPREWLAWAREGSAYLLRTLKRIKDAELSGDTLLPGWNRKMLVAHLGYNARAIVRLTEWGRTGIRNPMYENDHQRMDEIKSGATLNPAALHNLVAHSVAQLDSAWRNLSDENWAAMVVSAQGRDIPVSETPWMRAKEVWVHSVDLDKGGSFRDFPPELVDAIIPDVQGKWRLRGETPDITLEITDRPGTDLEKIVIGAGGPVVRGIAADVAQWLTGRGYKQLSRLEFPDGEVTIPRWF